MDRPRFARRGTAALLVAGLLATTLPGAVAAKPAHPNPAFAYVNLTAAAAGGHVVPLINSGDVFGDVTFEGIPDGIGVVPVGNGKRFVDLYVAFEQSHVPFQGFADFEDSSVQRVRLDTRTRQVVALEEVLPPSAGFLRFCSSFMAGPDQGFDDYTLFLNEESNDIVTVPPGAPYGSDPAIAPYRQAGYVVSLDVKTGAYRTIAGMGRHNHENAVVVPGGWKDVAVLSGDDTFSAPSSQLYLYTASSPGALKHDRGALWAFRVTATQAGPVDPTDAFNDANDYLEIAPGQAWSGEFIEVPGDVARGTTAAAPQAALEDWSNENNVFQFVRIEDLAYDPDNPRVVYFTDTGTTRLQESSATGRLFRASSGGTNTNGRVFKMVLNRHDPRIVDELSILVDGGSIGMLNPDNLDVGANSIMVQEDAANAKIWRYDMASGQWSHVGTVTHPTAPAAGESSGIVDVSRWLGAGWWALDVQSHVNLTTGPTDLSYTVPITGQVMTYRERREDGQLLLVHIPGS